MYEEDSLCIALRTGKLYPLLHYRKKTHPGASSAWRRSEWGVLDDSYAAACDKQEVRPTETLLLAK